MAQRTKKKRIKTLKSGQIDLFILNRFQFTVSIFKSAQQKEKRSRDDWNRNETGEWVLSRNGCNNKLYIDCLKTFFSFFGSIFIWKN